NFFFSSRRRHTRFKCDRSSDVCSSDLLASNTLEVYYHPVLVGTVIMDPSGAPKGAFSSCDEAGSCFTSKLPANPWAVDSGANGKIGRASCRERVAMLGGGE